MKFRDFYAAPTDRDLVLEDWKKFLLESGLPANAVHVDREKGSLSIGKSPHFCIILHSFTDHGSGKFYFNDMSG